VVTEQHEQEVKDVVWTPDRTMCATASADGTLKVWNTTVGRLQLHCIWTSPKKPSLVPTSMPFVKVALDAANGIIVGGLADGEIVAWSNIFSSSTDGCGELVEVRIPPYTANEGSNESIEQKEPTAIFIDTISQTKCAILAVHANDILCYRLDIDFGTSSHIRTLFGDGVSGLVTAVQPSFATSSASSSSNSTVSVNREEKSFVVVGDAFGCTHVFPWIASSVHDTAIQAFRTVEAFPDGDAVSSLTLTAHVLAVGSGTSGTIRVFDALSLAPLRSIGFPLATSQSRGRAPPEPITNLVVEREMLVASMGSRVLGWKTEAVASRVGKHLGRGLKQMKKEGAMKGQREYCLPICVPAEMGWDEMLIYHTEQFDLKRDIRESTVDLEHEQAYVKRMYGREREQRSALGGLGLSEQEAVDYILQLSRDEEEERRFEAATSMSVFSEDVVTTPMERAMSLSEEDIFAVAESLEALDFDHNHSDHLDVATPVIEHRESSWSWSASGTRQIPAPPASTSASRSPPSDVGIGMHIYAQPGSSPRLIPRTREPLAAGFAEDHESSRRTAETPATPSPPLVSEEGHALFPVLSRTPSSAGASVPGTPLRRGSSSASVSVSSSPQWRRIAAADAASVFRVPAVPGPSSPSSSRGSSAWSTPLRHRADPPQAPQSPTPARNCTQSTIMTPARSGSGSQAGILGSPSPPGFTAMSTGNEDDDLRFAIELSLAEARSRGEEV
jgi:hypothetical protein